MMRSFFWAAVLFGSSTAISQTTTVHSSGTSGAVSVSAAQANPKANSDDKLICERQEVLGSRLQGRRVCKTASQWADDRRLERAEVDRVQIQRSCC